MLKKIISSKVLKMVVSVVLIYVAFRKANILDILLKLRTVPIWFVIVNLLISFITLILMSYRWSLLLFEHSSWKKIFDLVRSNYIGYFYGLVSSTNAIGDLLKWVPLAKKYPDKTKTILLGSVLLDKFIGSTTFVAVAFLALIIGKIVGFIFPEFLLLISGIMFLAIIFFYVLVFVFKIEKIPAKHKIFRKLEEVISLLNMTDKRRLRLCLFISILCEALWIFPVWIISLFFGSGFTLLSVFVFLPIITLILILPISVAGFGGRELLFLFFFSQLGITNEQILLTSTFLGIIGILNSLFGGLLLF